MSKQKNTKLEDPDIHEEFLDDFANYTEEGPSKCKIPPHSGKKRSWTADEDAYLMKLVQKYGAQKWTSIAEHLPGKADLMQGESENSAGSDGTII